VLVTNRKIGLAKMLQGVMGTLEKSLSRVMQKYHVKMLLQVGLSLALMKVAIQMTLARVQQGLDTLVK